MGNFVQVPLLTPQNPASGLKVAAPPADGFVMTAVTAGNNNVNSRDPVVNCPACFCGTPFSFKSGPMEDTASTRTV